MAHTRGHKTDFLLDKSQLKPGQARAVSGNRSASLPSLGEGQVPGERVASFIGGESGRPSGRASLSDFAPTATGAPTTGTGASDIVNRTGRQMRRRATDDLLRSESNPARRQRMRDILNNPKRDSRAFKKLQNEVSGNIREQQKEQAFERQRTLVGEPARVAGEATRDAAEIRRQQGITQTTITAQGRTRDRLLTEAGLKGRAADKLAADMELQNDQQLFLLEQNQILSASDRVQLAGINARINIAQLNNDKDGEIAALREFGDIFQTGLREGTPNVAPSLSELRTGREAGAAAVRTAGSLLSPEGGTAAPGAAAPTEAPAVEQNISDVPGAEGITIRPQDEQAFDAAQQLKDTEQIKAKAIMDKLKRRYPFL